MYKVFYLLVVAIGVFSCIQVQAQEAKQNKTEKEKALQHHTIHLKTSKPTIAFQPHETSHTVKARLPKGKKKNQLKRKKYL